MASKNFDNAPAARSWRKQMDMVKDPQTDSTPKRKDAETAEEKKSTRLSLRLDADLYNYIRLKATFDRKTLTETINGIVREHYNEHGQQIRDQLQKSLE